MPRGWNLHSGRSTPRARRGRRDAAFHRLRGWEPLESRALLTSAGLIEPAADTTVDAANPDQNFGQAAALRVESADGESSAESVLRFELTGLEPQHVELTLYPTWTSGPDVVNRAFLLPDALWDEGALTWNDRPTDGALLASWTPRAGVPVSVDVTAAVQAILEAPLLGDMDTDGTIDFDDVDDFVLALTRPELYVDTYGVDPALHGDATQNGLFDFDDIPAFLDLLVDPSTDRWLHLRVAAATSAAGTSAVRYGSREAGDATIDPQGTVLVRPSLSLAPSGRVTTASMRFDEFSLDASATDYPLDVLANDNPLFGDESSWTITEVTPPENGGAASIAYGGRSLIYQPPLNFRGTERFQYTVQDGGGAVDQSDVFVHVGSAAARDRIAADEANADDRFGEAVAIQHERAVIGAYGDSVYGTRSGAAYVFEIENGTWMQAARLAAPDGAAHSDFGASVAMDGERVLVGSPGHGPQGTGHGEAYVFDRQPDASWSNSARLIAADGAFDDRFGHAVALEGDRALVGAYAKNAPDNDTGAAYLFERQPDNTWQQVAQLVAPDGDELDWFGYAVALSGNRAVVGAWRDDDQGDASGAAYVFEQQPGGQWLMASKLLAADGDEGDNFGKSVALAGDAALVGAPRDQDAGQQSGAAYLFARRADGQWQQQTKLTATDGDAGDEFGYAVALSGNRALVGARGDDHAEADAGSAYLFEQQPDGTWRTSAKLTAPRAGDGDGFGVSVSVRDDALIIGADKDDLRGENAGAAYADFHLRAAQDDSFAITQDTSYGVLPVLQNDGPAGELLQVSAVTPGSEGGAVWSDGKVIFYSPRPGFVGPETFTYSVARVASANTDTATVTVMVDPAGAPPAGRLLPTAFYGDGRDLVIDYDVLDAHVPPLYIEIHASSDGVALDQLLMTHRVDAAARRAVGNGHSTVFAAALANVPTDDYFLMARIGLTEQDPQPLVLPLSSGIFQTPDDTLHVHGTPDNDTANVAGHFITLDTLPVAASGYAISDVRQIRMHTHGGDDVIQFSGRNFLPLRLFTGTGDDTVTAVPATVLLDAGPGNNVVHSDTDGDGLLDSIEDAIGSDPTAFDTDGDSLPDGFEHAAAALDPLVPDDPQGDPDQDGLTNHDEAATGTRPDDPDSDGDGTSDAVEVQQGSNPSDPGDAGAPPEEGTVTSIALTVGDHSGSSSERYDLHVGRFTVSAGDYGVVETDHVVMPLGQTYPVGVVHRGTRLAAPDYDYTAGVGPSATPTNPVYTFDPNEILGVHDESDYFHADNKSALLHVPLVDLDVVLPDGTALPDGLEESEGGYLIRNRDDDDRDGIGDNLSEDLAVTGGDDDLLRLSLAAVAPSQLEGSQRITYPADKVRVWRTAQKTGFVESDVTRLPIDQQVDLWVEGIEVSNFAREVEIVATFVPELLGETLETLAVTDSVRVSVGRANLALDGLKELLEIDPGAIVWRNSDFSKAMPHPGMGPGEPDRYLPDYKPLEDFGDPLLDIYQFDNEFTEDYTPLRVAVAPWMVGLYDVTLTFPDNIVIWRPTPSGGDQLRSGVAFPATTERLELWVEGVAGSAGFHTDFIQMRVAPQAPAVAPTVFFDETHYTVVETNAGVDGNRDTTIDFTDNRDRQLLFWFNNDRETVESDGDYETDKLPVGLPDSDDNYIEHRRDLEDFAALRLFVDSALHAFALDVALGQPPPPNYLGLTAEYRLELELGAAFSINLYESANPTDDVRAHVNNEVRADVQAGDPHFRNAVVSYFGKATLPDIGPGVNKYLFEADGDQASQTTLSFVAIVTYADGTSTRKTHAIDLDVRDITDFYDRYDIAYDLADGTDLRQDVTLEHFPDAALVHSSQVAGRSYFDGQDTIVLVHGWNMRDTAGRSDKKVFADTAFKRLYWQGFTGRFVAFNWPTFTDVEGPRHVGGAVGPAANLTYNPSEFQAFRSGRALKNLLAGLPGNRHLLAHSMGNVVAAEALRLWSRQSAGPLVDTYVAMEAAVAAGLYGIDGSDAFDISGTVPVVGNISWPRSVYDESRVDLNRFWWSGFPSLTGPAQAYMTGSRSAAGTWVNLYNPDDVATNLAWRTNNLFKVFINQQFPMLPELPNVPDGVVYRGLFSVLGAGLLELFDVQDEMWRLLPPPAIWPWRYVVLQDELLGHRYYRVPHTTEGTLETDPATWIDLTPMLHDPSDEPGVAAYEIIAFLSQANVAAVGTKPLTDWFGVNIDIASSYVMPNGADARPNHSFQFHYDSAVTWDFWQEIREATGVRVTY